MTFDFYSFRFVFSALDPIVFPPGQPGNILRGASATRSVELFARPIVSERFSVPTATLAIMRASLNRLPQPVDRAAFGISPAVRFPRGVSGRKNHPTGRTVLV